MLWSTETTGYESRSCGMVVRRQAAFSRYEASLGGTVPRNDSETCREQRFRRHPYEDIGVIRREVGVIRPRPRFQVEFSEDSSESHSSPRPAVPPVTTVQDSPGVRVRAVTYTLFLLTTKWQAQKFNNSICTTFSVPSRADFTKRLQSSDLAVTH